MKLRLQLFLGLILATLFFTNCSVEKRLYSSGYYINSNFALKTTIDKNKIETLDTIENDARKVVDTYNDSTEAEPILYASSDSKDLLFGSPKPFKFTKKTLKNADNNELQLQSEKLQSNPNNSDDSSGNNFKIKKNVISFLGFLALLSGMAFFVVNPMLALFLVGLGFVLLFAGLYGKSIAKPKTNPYPKLQPKEKNYSQNNESKPNEDNKVTPPPNNSYGRVRTNPLSIAGFVISLSSVLSVVSALLPLSIFLALIGLLVSLKAKRMAKLNELDVRGKKLAKAGIIISSIFLVGIILLAILILVVLFAYLGGI